MYRKMGYGAKRIFRGRIYLTYLRFNNNVKIKYLNWKA